MLSGFSFAVVRTALSFQAAAMVLPTGVAATGCPGFVSFPSAGFAGGFVMVVGSAGGGPMLGKAKIMGPVTSVSSKGLSKKADDEKDGRLDSDS